MRNIIIAIHPEYSQKILAGEKTSEYRRSLPKERFGCQRWYIYETAPTKKVVGYFTTWGHVEKKVDYLGKVSKGYEIFISECCYPVVKFSHPVTIPLKKSIRNFIYCTPEYEAILEAAI